MDPNIEAEQDERLKVLRADRDNTQVRKHLDELRSAAEGTDNCLVPMKAALAQKATGGEVADALRDVWGSYTPADTF